MNEQLDPHHGASRTATQATLVNSFKPPLRLVHYRKFVRHLCSLLPRPVNLCHLFTPTAGRVRDTAQAPMAYRMNRAG